jgi:hypothetical protein
VVELFAVRFIHHLIAERKSLHPVPPVTRPRVPHASEVERAFTGTFTRVAPQRSFHPFPLDGICHPLCTITASACNVQTVGLSLSPCLRSSALDRIAGLLALETSDLQRQPPSVGLLDEASIERGEHVSVRHALRVGILADGLIPPPFIWLVARLLRLMPSIRITSVERFNVTDNRGRTSDRVDLISLFGKMNQRFGNSV